MYHGSSYLRGCDSREACSEDLLPLCLVHPPQGVVHHLPAQTKVVHAMLSSMCWASKGLLLYVGHTVWPHQASWLQRIDGELQGVR